MTSTNTIFQPQYSTAQQIQTGLSNATSREEVEKVLFQAPSTARITFWDGRTYFLDVECAKSIPTINSALKNGTSCLINRNSHYFETYVMTFLQGYRELPISNKNELALFISEMNFYDIKLSTDDIILIHRRTPIEGIIDKSYAYFTERMYQTGSKKGEFKKNKLANKWREIFMKIQGYITNTHKSNELFSQLLSALFACDYSTLYKLNYDFPNCVYNTLEKIEAVIKKIKSKALDQLKPDKENVKNTPEENSSDYDK